MQEWVINQMNFVEILGIIYTQEKGSGELVQIFCSRRKICIKFFSEGDKSEETEICQGKQFKRGNVHRSGNYR